MSYWKSIEPYIDDGHFLVITIYFNKYRHCFKMMGPYKKYSDTSWKVIPDVKVVTISASKTIMSLIDLSAFNQWKIMFLIIQKNKRIWTIDICDNVNELLKNYAKWKKWQSQNVHTVWFHLYISDGILEMENRLLTVMG